MPVEESGNMVGDDLYTLEFSLTNLESMCTIMYFHVNKNSA